METQNFDVVGSYNNQRITSIDGERSVNCFQYNDSLGKKAKSLINTSGLINTDSNFGAVAGGFRCQYVFLGIEYYVIGNTFFSETTAGVIATLGTLNTASGFVDICGNTFQLLLVDGVNGYVWDTLALTFTQITDTSFPAQPIDCCMLDEFGIVAAGSTNTFQLSLFDQFLVWGPDSSVFVGIAATDLLTIASTANYQTGVPFTVSTTGALPNPLVAGTTYYAIRIDATNIKVATSYANAIAGTFINLTSDSTATSTMTSLGQLQLGTMTSDSGTIVACRTLHRRLFLFSQFFTEVWENAGIGTNLPFRRNNSLLMEYGCAALGSIYVGFDKMFFLSQDRDGLGAIMEVAGTQSISVSTRALDFQLAQYAAIQQVADCRAFLIKENGLIFYRMNFTLANHTFVYNVSQSNPESDETKYWHEEETLAGNRHPAQTHAYFNGINYVGSYLSPILYQVDSDTFTNDGEPIRRMRICRPFVPPGYQRIRIDRFQLDLLQGNIAILFEGSTDINLDTEDGNDLLTESGVNIILETAAPQSTVMANTPVVFLSISKDGGQTYGYRIRGPLGRLGQRSFRTVWRKLGTIPRGQAFVVKLEFFDAIPFICMGASWAIEIMPE